MAICAMCKLNSKNVDPMAVSFHPFPKEKNLLKKWLQVVDRQGWWPKSNDKVCSLHFLPEELYNSTEIFLVQGAVPHKMIVHISASTATFSPSFSLFNAPRRLQDRENAAQSIAAIQRNIDHDHTYALTVSPSVLKHELDKLQVRKRGVQKELNRSNQKVRRLTNEVISLKDLTTQLTCKLSDNNYKALNTDFETAQQNFNNNMELKLTETDVADKNIPDANGVD